MLSLCDDTLLLILRHLRDGYEFSKVSMACRRLRRVTTGDGDVEWQELLRRRCDELGTFSCLPRRLRFVHFGHEAPCCPANAREGFAYAYLCCKHAVRAIRHEYVVSYVLISDSILHVLSTMSNMGMDEEMRSTNRAWIAFEKTIHECPMGQRWNALTLSRRLLPSLDKICESLRVVSTYPGFYNPVCQKRLQGGEGNEVLANNTLWELKRIVRRFMYAQRVTAYAHRILY